MLESVQISDSDVCSKFNFSIKTGWLVWLRRLNNSVSFHRKWADYKAGFGDKDGNYWLGLDKLYCLTKSNKNCKLRIELKSWKNEKKWAEYGKFRVANESLSYKLLIGDYNKKSTLNNNMMKQNNKRQFTTKDKDNDVHPRHNCARSFGKRGGWWYSNCGFVHPTGIMGRVKDRGTRYTKWRGAFKGPAYQSLKSLSMMIKQKY